MEKNLERIYSVLSESRPYFLSTMDGDQPRVRPFGSLYIYDGKLFFSTFRWKAVYAQLKKSPQIQLATVTKDGWVRVTARAVEDESLETRQTIWRMSAAVTERDPDNMDEQMAAFYLQDAQAILYINGADPETFAF